MQCLYLMLSAHEIFYINTDTSNLSAQSNGLNLQISVKIILNSRKSFTPKQKIVINRGMNLTGERKYRFVLFSYKCLNCTLNYTSMAVLLLTQAFLTLFMSCTKGGVREQSYLKVPSNFLFGFSGNV